jgi:protocatechuate 3,4-dioxygenase alpha subunit
MLPSTPSQTIGPFFHAALIGAVGTERDPGGERQIEVFGRVLDGDGVGVTDALIETWQSATPGDARPTCPRAAFTRCATDDDGGFVIRTLAPRSVSLADGGVQAPHLLIAVFARGLLKHLVTRLYFAGTVENDRDPVLAEVPEARRRTLIAARADPLGRYRFDIVLQGGAETVFFECQRAMRDETT